MVIQFLWCLIAIIGKWTAANIDAVFYLWFPVGNATWDKLPVLWPRRCGGLRVSAVRLGFRCSVCQCGKAFPPAQDGHQTIRGQWVNSTSFYLKRIKCLSNSVDSENLRLLCLPYDFSSLDIRPQSIIDQSVNKKLCNYKLFFGSCCSFQMIVYFPENMHIFPLCMLFYKVYILYLLVTIIILTFCIYL